MILTGEMEMIKDIIVANETVTPNQKEL